MYKPIKHYLLVPMERIRCFSHEESKIPWANTSIYHIDCCKWSLTFCTTLYASCFSKSLCTFKQTCTCVQLHKM